MKYNHISIEEREKIQEMMWQKASMRAIAKEIGRSPSSISREINKNIPLQRSYRSRLAHRRALKKRECRGRKLRLKNGVIRRYVIDHLKKGYSPEQVAGRLKVEQNQHISHEAIYQYIYSQVHRDGYGHVKPYHHDLRQYLKRRHKRRQRKGLRKSTKTPKFNGISIEQRPRRVEHRKEIGHWEGDSVVSKKSKVGLNTLVERKTGLVFISKIKNGTAIQTSTTVIGRLRVMPLQCRKTLTLDNGSENAGWKDITNTLSTICYFAHPYCSGERGTNENTNGLIRWYFPKGTDFAKVTNEDIAMVEYALNTRPRKRLRWRTPLEVFNQNLQSVALTG